MKSFIYIGNQFKDFCFASNQMNEDKRFSRVLQLTQNSIESVTYSMPNNIRAKANNSYSIAPTGNPPIDIFRPYQGIGASNQSQNQHKASPLEGNQTRNVRVKKPLIVGFPKGTGL